MGDLPELATLKIVRSLAESSVFQLIALGSVSSSWRAILKQTHIPELRLESCQDLQHRTCSAFQRDVLAAKFHRSSTTRKTAFFVAAAKLLRNRTAVFCSGRAVTDAVVTEVAMGTAESVTVQVRLDLAEDISTKP